MGSFLFQLGPPPPRPQALQAAYEREPPCAALCSPGLKHFERSLRIDDLSLDAELVVKLRLPLPLQHRRTDHQEPLRVVPAPQLGPYQSCLDGLTQANLVGDQQAVRR